MNQWVIEPATNQGNIITGKGYRISILTSRLVRLEYQEENYFEDRCTQTVINRAFSQAKFSTTRNGDDLRIETECLTIWYDGKPFSSNGLRIRIKENGIIWRFGSKGNNLKGTARTLDNCDGATELEDGILSMDGYVLLDDSVSMAIKENSWVDKHIPAHTDLYFLGYGRDYLGCLKDFYNLCGKTPLLPRYALGNWWSRFYAYTEDEYKTLINQFGVNGLPFSVAVIDMDWHHVKIDPKYGSGWTGYTWNTELFPNHIEFMEWLHKKNLRVTLNLHPADGVRAFEKQYLPMAKEMGVDFENEEPVVFDVANPKFMKCYFDILHHPLEEEGVDFWWIDWQQGTNSNIEGLDPLWMLNHYHYLDNGRTGKRPFLFSRYAGIGSHRYPVGFSGDTYITWESLDFQPYFTTTASNAGYGWWSHDIGGHMMGYRDDELTTRWVQYGVFSPIMRLHSGNSAFSGKEPWNYDAASERTMTHFLRFRHALIPYLYTMNARFHNDSIPLIQPLYYKEPHNIIAYETKNEYYFGDLLVSPITTPMNKELRAAGVVTWVPEGLWYDIFTGKRYSGGKKVKMFRPLETIPVLAKAGTILPMQQIETVTNDTNNPVNMELRVFAGSNGTFELYEDDGSTMEFTNNKYATTTYRLNWEEHTFLIEAAKGDISLIPQQRQYRICFYGVPENFVKGIRNGADEIESTQSYSKKGNILSVVLPHVPVTASITIELDCSVSTIDATRDDLKERLFEVLNRAQIDYSIKNTLYKAWSGENVPLNMLCALSTCNTPDSLKDMIAEILFTENEAERVENGN